MRGIGLGFIFILIAMFCIIGLSPGVTHASDFQSINAAHSTARALYSPGDSPGLYELCRSLLKQIDASNEINKGPATTATASQRMYEQRVIVWYHDYARRDLNRYSSIPLATTASILI